MRTDKHSPRALSRAGGRARSSSRPRRERSSVPRRCNPRPARPRWRIPKPTQGARAPRRGAFRRPAYGRSARSAASGHTAIGEGWGDGGASAHDAAGSRGRQCHLASRPPPLRVPSRACLTASAATPSSRVKEAPGYRHAVPGERGSIRSPHRRPRPVACSTWSSAVTGPPNMASYGEHAGLVDPHRVASPPPSRLPPPPPRRVRAIAWGRGWAPCQRPAPTTPAWRLTEPAPECILLFP